jgi:phosphopantetheine adenylyltransferase
LDISKRAAEKSETLIIGVGQNPDKKYMFSFPERVEMIK